MSVAQNIARIRESIGSSKVKLIAVTKYVSPEQIEEAFKAGLTEFGENRVQDALAKIDLMPAWLKENASWHFIGHLQTNKVKYAVGKFCLIHSVDSMRLAQEISRIAQIKKTIQPILLQVKIADDPDKGGFRSEELEQCFLD